MDRMAQGAVVRSKKILHCLSTLFSLPHLKSPLSFFFVHLQDRLEKIDSLAQNRSSDATANLPPNVSYSASNGASGSGSFIANDVHRASVKDVPPKLFYLFIYLLLLFIIFNN